MAPAYPIPWGVVKNAKTLFFDRMREAMLRLSMGRRVSHKKAIYGLR